MHTDTLSKTRRLIGSSLSRSLADNYAKLKENSIATDKNSLGMSLNNK